MSRQHAQKITRHLRSAYPQHVDLFGPPGKLTLLERRPGPVPEAIVRIVTGQMISTAVARVLYQRISDTAAAKTGGRSWQLGYDDLKRCGLSNAKCRTITEFALRYAQQPAVIDAWTELPAEALFEAVSSFWGMSNWTASILGLFYFANEDIFPDRDGTIKKALRMLSEDKGLPPIDPLRASPYRSYLALALWKAVDEGALM